MPDISNRTLRNWADETGLVDLTVAEQDFRISYALRDLFEDGYLKSVLLLKGGTAINKLYLKDTSRISVDIDVNHTGENKDTVAGQAKSVREAIVRTLSRQDPGYRFTVPRKDWYQTTIHAIYKPIIVEDRKLKIEVSHIERFPITEPTLKSFVIPGNSKETCNIPTYSLDELMATKYRALFTRAKGRDIYDIYHALKLGIDRTLVRKMFIYYLFRVGKVYNPKLDLVAVRNRLSNKQYVDDVTGYVKQRVSFSLAEAALSVIADSKFLGELDERDRVFIALARSVLKKKQQASKSHRDAVKQITHPLNELFQPELSITSAARKITLEEIKPRISDLRGVVIDE